VLRLFLKDNEEEELRKVLLESWDAQYIFVLLHGQVFHRRPCAVLLESQPWACSA
jgi:hypothetical protein